MQSIKVRKHVVNCDTPECNTVLAFIIKAQLCCVHTVVHLAFVYKLLTNAYHFRKKNSIQR